MSTAAKLKRVCAGDERESRVPPLALPCCAVEKHSRRASAARLLAAVHDMAQHDYLPYYEKNPYLCEQLRVKSFDLKTKNTFLG